MSALEYLDEMNESGRVQYDDYVNLHNAVSLEAAKAETTTVFQCRGSRHLMQSFGSRDAAIEHARRYDCSIYEREVTEWRPVETEGGV